MSFQAKVKLSNLKAGPLTHTGFRGRVLKKGEAFTTTNPEEAAYYRAQPGFTVTVIKGKLKGPEPREIDVPEDADLDHEDEDEEHDSEEEEREPNVSGGYEKADLKKLSLEDLLSLIDNDHDLPLKSKDVPKKARKKEVIMMILDAQRDARGKE